MVQEKVCGEQCNLAGCLLDLDTKRLLFNNFYKSGDYSVQRTYLAGNMSVFYQGQMKRCNYTVPLNGQKLSCCRQTFIDVHRISKSVIETVMKEMEAGRHLIADARGKHLNRPRETPEDLKAIILEHINSFPKYETHYSRERAGQYFLSPSLTKALMFRLFLQRHPERPDYARKEKAYLAVLNETKLRIGQPRVDTCKYCDLFQMRIKCANDVDKPMVTEEHNKHLGQAQTAYAQMKLDAERSAVDQNYIVKCVDMQKVIKVHLNCKLEPHSEFQNNMIHNQMVS